MRTSIRPSVAMMARKRAGAKPMAANSRLFVTPTKPRFERSGGGLGLTCTTNNKKSAQAPNTGKKACAVGVSSYKWLPKPRPPVQQVPAENLGIGLFKPKKARTEKRKVLYSCRYPTQVQMKNGQTFWFPCRKCHCCKGNRINDLTGKLIAQSLSSYDVWFWTLTYDDALIADQDINPTLFRRVEHVQNFINAIRMQGERATGQRINLSYFACYEKGEQRKRGHWHVLLFWNTDVDDSTLSEASVSRAIAENAPPLWMMKTSTKQLDPARFKNVQNNPEIVELRGGRKAQQYVSVWPHGRVTVESLMRGPQATPQVHRIMAYCVKYVTKEPQRYLCSQAMGQAFFNAQVRAQLAAGLQLNDLNYSFADQFKMASYKNRYKELHAIENGGSFVAKERRRVYQIQGVARDRCIRYAVRLHRDRVKNRWRQHIADTGEKLAKLIPRIRDEMSLERIGQEPVIRRWERQAWKPRGSDDHFDRMKAASSAQDLIANEVQAELDAAASTWAERLARKTRPMDYQYYNPVAKKRREVAAAKGLAVEPPPRE